MTTQKTNSTFVSQNIIAILAAAATGGTIEDIIARTKIDMSASSLKKWLKDGKKDMRQDRQTAYAIFAEQWDAVYPGAPPRYEAARMAEMKKALEHMGIERKCPAPAPAPNARRTGAQKACECGNEKGAKEDSCKNCQSMDRRIAA